MFSFSFPLVHEDIVSFRLHPKTFYNPHSTLTRTLGVLALSTQLPARVLDGCSASGVRALRYLSLPHTHVTATDTHGQPQHLVLQKNLSKYVAQGRARVLNERFEDVIVSDKYDFVDMDIFGMPSIATCAQAVQGVKQGGLLYICATDAAGGAGCRGDIGDIYVERLPAANEQFLRIVMGNVWRGAGGGVRPMFAYFEKRTATARVMVRVGESGEGVGAILWCEVCGEYWVDEKKCECRGKTRWSGPIWTGELQDEEMLNSMMIRGKGRALQVLDGLRKERGIMYYDLGEVGKRLGKVPRVKSMVGVERAHAGKRSVKCTRGLRGILEAARNCLE